MPKNTTERNAVILQQEVIVKFWPVAVLVLIVFIAMDFLVLKDYVMGTVHLANLMLIIISMPICLKNNNVVWASNILAALGMLTIMPMIFTGGSANTGFWWSVVYVVGVFLVTSKRWAIFWLLLYLTVSIFIVILSVKGIVKIAYTIPELLNLLFIFSITFTFIYFFNQVRTYYLQLSNARREELEHLNKDMEEFVYIASHDLQEPLITISNYVKLIEEKLSGRKDKDLDQYIEFSLDATSRMQNLIKDLLDLSRIGRNVIFEKVDCDKVLREVMAEIDASIRISHAKITYSDLPVINGSEIELKRLFQNLICNAIKFQKQGNIPEINITVEQKELEYIFAVKDNGIGIEKEFLHKLFVIFQRLHDDTEYKGTGIGLAICKKIVALHTGKIWVTSKVGQGSTFYFTISKQI